MSRQEIVDKLNEWKHICDLEQIEIKKLKCQIDILEDKISTNKFNSNQISYYNKLPNTHLFIYIHIQLTYTHIIKYIHL